MRTGSRHAYRRDDSNAIGNGGSLYAWADWPLED